MDPTTTTTTASSTADDTSPFKRQHEHNFLLDDDIQKRLLLSVDDDDCDDNYTDPQPTTSVQMGHLLDNDPHPWHSGWVHRTTAPDSATSVNHRPRGPRINYVTRYSTGNRSKEISFSFHHYADPARYMEQYRRDYTYANLDPVKVVEDQFPWADHRLRQTAQCQTGRTEMYSKRHSAPSIDFQGQRLDWNHHRTMRDSTSVDGLSRRNLEVFENSETSGLSSMNKFWTFDTSHVLPVLYNNNSNNNNTVGTERTRYLGGSAMELVGGLAVFSGKEAKHFPGNGFAMDDQSVKRLSYSRVPNLQLPIAGIRAIDTLAHSSHARLGKAKFHKSHHFDVLNEINLMSGATKPGIGGERLPFQKDLPNHSILPRGGGPPVPTWVAFDKQVLCFDAYYQEGVQERRDEQFRVHRCKVYFYLEDDSVQVVEPRMKNAGLPQGSIIRRHRINRPPPNDDTFLTIDDFDIGNELMMYSRKFKLVNCDEFTRNFMRKLGIKLRQPIEIPDDPYSEHRRALDDTMQPLRPYEKRDTLKQFLDHDRHVLRFFCIWDDRDVPFGDPHEMVLHYYLADDTIEVREIVPANSGRDAVPMFLHRGKLPKILEPMRKPGELADRTVLNVFGPMGHGGRFILDNLKTGAVNQEFYADSDLTIGAYVNIWGRKFLICDCDDFTKEYYRAKYGVNDFTPLRRVRDQVLGTLQPTSAEPSTRPAPPYNGFGGEEDSLNSTQSLLPRPPKRDFVKFMGKDRQGLDGNVLRFLARLDSTKPGDAERRFVISYFLADDTVVVFEPTVRNSGIPGGKFLERGKVKRPNQVQFSTQPPTYYAGGDFHVGARLEFNKHKFILVDADDYAYNYMEQNCHQFPQSNIQMILPKLAEAFRQLRPEELAPRRHIPVDDFQSLLTTASGGRLTNQEIVTVSRFYQDRADDQLELDAVLGVAQEQLKRAGFEDFTSIINNCLHFDRDRTGKLHPQRLRLIFRSVRVPIQDDILRAILSILTEGSDIAYGNVVKLINWRTYQVQSVKQTTSVVYEDTWQGNQSSAQIQNVNMEALLQDLSGANQR